MSSDATWASLLSADYAHRAGKLFDSESTLSSSSPSFSKSARSVVIMLQPHPRPSCPTLTADAFWGPSRRFESTLERMDITCPPPLLASHLRGSGWVSGNGRAIGRSSSTGPPAHSRLSALREDVRGQQKMVEFVSCT